MKMIFTLGLVFIGAHCFAQQWFVTYFSSSRDANAVWILHKDDFVIAGGHEYNDSIEDIFRTENSGVTWGPFRDTVSSWIKSIAFTNSDTGYAVGYNGKLMKTTDGVNSWTYYQSPVDRDFNKVIYVTPSLMFVAGGKLANDSMQTILKSIDGGNSWSVVYDQAGPWLKSIFFIDTLNGFATGNTGTLLKTSNGGTTWTPQAPPVSRNFNTIVFTSASNGFIVGGDTAGGQIRTILQTTNGGGSWNVVKDETGGQLNDISFAGPLQGLIVGDSSTVFKTIDGGQTWLPDSLPYTNSSEYFNAVQVYDSSYAVIGSRYGYIYVYTNSQAPQVQTLNALNVDSSNATLAGSVNMYGSTGDYWFTWATDSLFTTPNFTQTANIYTDTTAIVTGNPYLLTPNTNYYYFLSAATIAGTVSGDTLHFFTGVYPYTFATLPASAVTGTSAQLNGVIGKFTDTANVFFEYGLSVALGSQVAGSPPVITDSLLHNISGQVSSLLPNNLCYFRLKVISAGNTFYGNTYVFYTGNPPGTLIANAASVTDTSVTLSGTGKGFIATANITFEYGTDSSSFASSVLAFPATITDSLQHTLTASLTNLIPDTVYYYRIRANTELGDYYSDTVAFNVGPSFYLGTLPPHNLSPATATLYGTVNANNVPGTFSFQYGIGQAFDHEIAASPAQLSSSSNTTISAAVTGLQAGQQYYFRVKAVNSSGTFYSDSRSFYAVQNEVPNWSFENWQPVQNLFPKQWWILGNVAEAPSYNGTTALSLYGNASVPGGGALTGINLYGVTAGGTPFTAHPDSLIFFADYSIDTGDTGYVLLALRKNGANISNALFPLTGSTSGNFVRTALPISYTANGNPDTVMIAFISTNFFGSHLSALSWLKVDDISFSGTTQNVPDPGFEQWDTVTYQIPSAWAVPMHQTPFNENTGQRFTRTADAYFGSYAINLDNTYSDPFDQTMSSTIISTDNNFQNGSPNPSFAVSKRYNSFNGYYKFLRQSNDSVNIRVAMFSGGNLIANAIANFYAPAYSYQPFFIPVYYSDSTSIPDSSSIYITVYYNSLDSSVLTLDDLGFDGFYDTSVNTGVRIYDVKEAPATLNLYPNPNQGILHVDYNSAISEPITLSVLDLSGRVLLRRNYYSVSNANADFTLNLSDLGSSVYFVNVKSVSVNITSRFILAR